MSTGPRHIQVVLFTYRSEQKSNEYKFLTACAVCNIKGIYHVFSYIPFSLAVWWIGDEGI